MKYFTFILLTLSLFSTHSLGNAEDINPDTARAYEGYLLTFLWPDNQTTEFIEYDNVLSLDGLTRIIKNKESEHIGSGNIGQTLSAFEENLETQIGKRIPILVSQKWTFIFKHAGDTVYKEFHSEQFKDGYPELTGQIAIKLGRYLESNISYQHYLFDSFTQLIPEEGLADDQRTAELKAFEPALMLTLKQSNKTASKKLNYLDHPTIGTLLYFEPVELEEAMATLTAQSNPPETGEGLNYNNLQSMSELLN